MEKHRVVPDIINTVPPAVCKVVFPTNVVADMGNILTPRQTKDEPTVTWPTEENTLYTLCLTDPDSPSRLTPSFREWHHWLVVNIPGNDIKSGEVLSAFVGTGPPKGTGIHRYVFLVYKQKGKLQCNERRLPNTSGNYRGLFSIKRFAKKYKLGQPIAGNLYQAEWDDYVPILYKQLNY